MLLSGAGPGPVAVVGGGAAPGGRREPALRGSGVPGCSMSCAAWSKRCGWFVGTTGVPDVVGCSLVNRMGPAGLYEYDNGRGGR